MLTTISNCTGNRLFAVIILLFVNPAMAQLDEAAIAPKATNVEFAQVTVDEHRLHYAYAGDPSKKGLLFLHGTPGSWDAFERYLTDSQLKQDFFMVSIDRLGWGNSPLAGNLIDGGFALQARSIAAVMAQYPGKRWTIIGHSLGASIAPKVALIRPQAVDSLLLLAGSLNPKLGKPRWYNRIANTWVVSRLIGKSMRYSNREIMGLKKELEKLSSDIKNNRLNTHLTIIQGMKDRLVSPKNPTFAQQHWQGHFARIEIIELEDEGHFLPWRQTPLVIETIYRLNADTSNSRTSP